jgi:hypothetical protein
LFWNGPFIAGHRAERLWDGTAQLVGRQPQVTTTASYKNRRFNSATRTRITTHCMPLICEPSHAGIVPLSWLASRNIVLRVTITDRHGVVRQHHSAKSTRPGSHTHVKPVSEPRDSGRVPFSRLSLSHRSLPSRSHIEITPSHSDLGVAVTRCRQQHSL